VMSTETYTWDRIASHADLDELVRSGALSLGLVLASSGEHGGPVTVRPPIAELSDDWASPIETAAGLRAGSRIAVVGHDAADTAGVAAELAVRLGDGGNSVILIDGHIERPAIGKALAEDGDEGLVDCVLFGVSPSLAARRTLAPGVRLMTAGSYPLSVDEVLGSDTFSQLLGELSEGAVVVIALPGAHLKLAGPVITSVVAVGRDPRDLSSLAALAGEAGVRDAAGVLITAPRPAAPVAARETIGPLEPAAVDVAPGAPAEREPEEDAPVGAAEDREPPTEPADAVRIEGRPSPEAPPPWAREERPRAHPVITAALPREPARRRSRAPAVVIAVVAVVAVAAWIGLRGPPGLETRPALERERPSGDAPIEPEGEALGTERAAEPGERPDTPGTLAGAPTPGQRVRDPAAAEQADREEPAPTPAAAQAGTDGESAGERRVPTGPIAGPGGRYTVFVSSHRILSAAEIESDELGRVGVSATIVETEVGATGTWYRVAVSGGYPTLAAARLARSAVAELGYEGAWIERTQESH